MDASRCQRCGAALPRDAAACATCGTPVPAAETLTQQYREGQRLLQSPVMRAAYVLPLFIPASVIGALIISKLVPKEYEDVVSNVLGGVIAVAVFGMVGAMLVVSIRSAAKTGFANIVPQTRPKLADFFRWQWKPADPPPAPFDESPAARAARIEQLRALNGMVRAARANAAPFLLLGKLMLMGFPVVMLLVAVGGVVTIIQGAIGHLPPKTSMEDGVLVTAVGLVAAAAFHGFLIAPHRRLARRVTRLAEHVGSRVVSGHVTAMIDWLDQHWPELVPSSGPAAMGWHWIVPFTFQARPALLSVLDDLGGRGLPRVRRIDVYLACPCNAPLLGAEAVARVRALGFDAVQSPAGVRLERRDNDPAALAPEVLDALFRCFNH